MEGPCDAMLEQIRMLREAAKDAPHPPIMVLHPYRDCDCPVCTTARYLPTVGFRLAMYGENDPDDGGKRQLYQVEQHLTN